MLTVTGIGRVTADLEPKKSEKTGNEYLRFGIAINKGHGDNQKTVFLQCMLYGEQQVQRMINAKVQKGSLIAVSGELDVEEYKKKDGTPDKSVKVMLYDWNYVPSSGKSKDETAPIESQNSSDITENDDLPL
ncbi:MAG: single-stranded DNA-binding protein [Oscillospiraceae bacterium]|nr:single-stranded DNA-binding protein [Oscillospiraceae bacterium]